MYAIRSYYASREVTAIVISSVVPPLTPTIVDLCVRYFGITPLVVGPGVKTGISIKMDNPKEVGARITSYNVCYTKLLRRDIDDVMAADEAARTVAAEAAAVVGDDQAARRELEVELRAVTESALV